MNKIPKKKTKITHIVTSAIKQQENTERATQLQFTINNWRKLNWKRKRKRERKQTQQYKFGIPIKRQCGWSGKQEFAIGHGTMQSNARTVRMIISNNQQASDLRWSNESVPFFYLRVRARETHTTFSQRRFFVFCHSFFFFASFNFYLCLSAHNST